MDDNILEFFYQPHTITTMLVTVIALTYTAFARDEMADWHSNVSTGLVGVVVIFMILSVPRLIIIFFGNIDIIALKVTAPTQF